MTWPDGYADMTAQIQHLRATEAGATAKTEHLQGQVADQAREIKALSVAVALAEARENNLVDKLAVANDLLEKQQSSAKDSEESQS